MNLTKQKQSRRRQNRPVTEDLDSYVPDSELEETLDVLNYIFQTMEPLKEAPDEALQEKVQDFIDFMGFHPGTLHKSLIRFPWFFGNLEDPKWLGSVNGATEMVVQTEPEEPFLVVGMILLKETYSHPERDDAYAYYLKAMVQDKIVYAPFPMGQMDENIANHYKTIFRQIVVDN